MCAAHGSLVIAVCGVEWVNRFNSKPKQIQHTCQLERMTLTMSARFDVDLV